MSTVLITETFVVTDTETSDVFRNILSTEVLTTTTTIVFLTTQTLREFFTETFTETTTETAIETTTETAIETATETAIETATETRTLVSVPPTSTPSTEYSESTVIPLGVFTALGGLAILVGVIGLASYCLRRRRRATDRDASPSAAGRAYLRRRARSVPNYDPDELPQDAASSDLRRSFSTLDTDLKNWASEFFHTTPSGMEKIHDHTLIDLLSDSRPHDEQAAAWFSQVKSHKSSVVFVRSYVARVLLDRIDKEGSPRTTLLPSHLLHCYQDIARQAMRGKPSAGLPPPDIHYWRSKTASLTYYQRQGQPVELSEDCITKISSIERKLLDALAPLRNNRPQDRCAKGLDTIAREVAQFGLAAFAQANEVTIYWPSFSADQTVVFPGLKQREIDTGDVLTIREFGHL